MRRLLVAVLSVGVLVAPTTLAFAADNNDQQYTDQSIAAAFPLAKAEPLDVARREVDRATDRARQRQEQIRERRIERREAAEEAAAETTGAASAGSSSGASPQLQSIAECESGGDYSANTGNGFYGAYQFTPETWASVGGSGLPSEAPPAEQDRRAQMLLAQSGTSPWPVCGG